MFILLIGRYFQGILWVIFTRFQGRGALQFFRSSRWDIQLSRIGLIAKFLMETYITCDFPEGLLYQDILGAYMISDAAICTYDRVFKPYTEKQKFSLSAYIMSVDVAF